MSTSPISNAKPDIRVLLKAHCQRPQGHDAQPGADVRPQWEILGDYMQPIDLVAGRILISQGAEDRTLYFVESGMLTVHFEDADRQDPPGGGGCRFGRR